MITCAGTLWRGPDANNNWTFCTSIGNVSKHSLRALTTTIALAFGTSLGDGSKHLVENIDHVKQPGFCTSAGHVSMHSVKALTT